MAVVGWLVVADRLGTRLPSQMIVGTRSFDRPLAEQVADVDVLIPSNSPVDAAVIRAAPRLKLIQQPATGYEDIDLHAAREHGIPVCNAPGANADSMAETALFLILSLFKRARLMARSLAARVIGEPLGHELASGPASHEIRSLRDLNGLVGDHDARSKERASTRSTSCFRANTSWP